MKEHTGEESKAKEMPATKVQEQKANQECASLIQMHRNGLMQPKYQAGAFYALDQISSPK